MTMRLWKWFIGWTALFSIPIIADILLWRRGHPAYSTTIRHVESQIPHGKAVGTAVITGLWAYLMWHFHWEHSAPGQRW